MTHRLLMLLTAALLAATVTASGFAADAAPKVYLEVSPDDEDDLGRLFDTIEGSLDDALAIDGAVVVVLHGEEAWPFARGSAGAGAGAGAASSLVDRAARLDAFELVELRMCETWMQANDIERADLPPFVEVVPFAPEEVERLEEEGYVPFSRVQL